MISVSICTYHTSAEELDRCISSLKSPVIDSITIVDNGEETRLQDFAASRSLNYIALPNPGFGAAHNAALMQSRSPYHLVLNADVYFPSETLGAMVDLLERNPEVVQLQPRVEYPDGTPQYCSRRLPSPFIVFGRRFLPKWMMRKANSRYLLHDMDLTQPLSVPYQTGCFMLLRTSVAQSIGGFDERFFMYPEDIDLSRRMAAVGTVLYWPGATIIHDHAAASYSSGRMLRIHISNMLRYFYKWAIEGAPGLRRKINKKVATFHPSAK